MASEATAYGIRDIGQGVPYLDGAEDALFEIVNGASDRSSRSDELAAHITDWPTRYHLSRLRGNILMPLQVSEGLRVLDVGCGTGALTRRLAEQEAHVTGLEGSLARARVAAARTSGLVNCEIVRGSLAEYVQEGHAGEFDLVILCGVLEYAGNEIGGGGSPAETLAQVRDLLKPDGALAVAIENQLGLKYLLGYPEDHRGVPWIGVDGYRSGKNPAQTWHRAALSEILQESGLGRQEWFFPFPDYKLPTVVVHSDLFDSSSGRQLLELFIRTPVRDFSGTSMLTVDTISAFRTMVAAGLGKDVANSFLVLAGREGSNWSGMMRDGQMWLSSPERAAELMDRRVVKEGAGGWQLITLDGRPQVHLPPLVSVRSDVPIVLGSNLEDEIVDVAGRAQSPMQLKPLLDEWWSAAQLSLLPEDKPGEYHFDVMPRNFIRSSSGSLEYVDVEWIWAADAPVNWALLRAMWYLVLERLWPAGSMAGLSWSLTLGEAALALARQIDPSVSIDDLQEAAGLEAELQVRVTGGSLEQARKGQLDIIARPLLQLVVRPPLAQILERPLILEEQAQQRMRLAELKELQAQDEIIGNQAELESLQFQNSTLQAKIDWIYGRRPRGQVQRLRRAGGKIKRKLLD